MIHLEDKYKKFLDKAKQVITLIICLRNGPQLYVIRFIYLY